MADWIDYEALKKEAAQHWRDVLEHYGLKPKRSGRQLVALCPFHEETEPSFKVTPGDPGFHCFGCGAKGNALDFVKRKEIGSLPEVARELAAICDIDLPMKERDRGQSGAEMPTRGRRKPQERRRGSRTTKDGFAPFRGAVEPAGGSPEPVAVNQPLTFALKLDPDHPYRLTRGEWLTLEVAEEFGLGFCSRGMMKDRYCIPIHNERGELVAYAGRWVGSDDEIPDGKGKYELPPRDKFDRGLELFNLHRAAEVVYGGEHVVVVEGYFGAIRLHIMGVPVVATMGNSISDAQLALLGCFQSATVLYDGGENGRAAADRAALRLCRAKVFTQIADLPDGEQPDTVDVAVLRGLLP